MASQEHRNHKRTKAKQAAGGGSAQKGVPTARGKDGAAAQTDGFGGTFNRRGEMTAQRGDKSPSRSQLNYRTQEQNDKALQDLEARKKLYEYEIELPEHL